MQHDQHSLASETNNSMYKLSLEWAMLDLLQQGSRHSRPSATVIPGDWQTVPDDVLQAVLVYLTASEVATARLTCRHWRLTLSSYTAALTLPTRFLASKAARGALRRAGRVFPGAQQVTLFHANGWCDPVQARMDVEPLVRLESRLVSLEPLAVGLPQLTRLAIQDATFTRDPWPLSQLLWLTGLKGLEVSWDTGLWAPGQVLQEAEALQPVFSMNQLTELILAKSAYLFLGELCLSDSTVAAAAGLRNLKKLSLSTVRVQDDGFASLAMLPHLTHLTLRGQLNVTLGVLSQVFLATTQLEELSLGCLVPSAYDLKRLAAAHSRFQRPATTRRQQQQQHRQSIRRQLQHQQRLAQQLQLQENRKAVAAATAAATVCTSGSSQRSSSDGRNSSNGRQTASGHWPGQPCRSASAAHKDDIRADISTHSSSSSSCSTCSSLSRSSHSTSSSSSSQGSIGVRFKGNDWSAVLLPLQRLRRLQLQSDLVLLGSCAALRSMASISHLELHGAAKFLSASPSASLPLSWLRSLAQQHSATIAAATAASSNMAQVITGSSSSSSNAAVSVNDAHSMPGRSPSAAQLMSARGAWPALKSLQVDNLQLADEFVEGVRQLASLRTLIVSGPCLLTQRQAHDDGGGLNHHRHHQQQQQHHRVSAQVPLRPTSEGVGALQQQQWQQQQHKQRQWRHSVVSSTEDGPPGSMQHVQAQCSVVEIEAATSSSSSSSNEGKMEAAKQQQQLAVLPDLCSLAGLSAQSEKRWTDAADHSLYSGATGIIAPAAATTATAPLAELGWVQRSRLGAAGAAQLPVDLDMLSRLSPLEELACFQLHLQQHMPNGLALTPFALVHLAAHWNQLTSISIDITPPAAAALSDQHCGPAAAAAATAEVGLMLNALASLTSLKDLSLRMADRCAGDCASLQSASLSAAAAAAGQRESAWRSLPSSLESLSLHGFTLQGPTVRDMGPATPQLKHLRLLHCHVSTCVLWCIAQAWPQLFTLVVKAVPMMGVGTSGVAAVAGLTQLRVLALSLEPMADVSSLAELLNLRFLLLDGRSNTQLSGVKALRRLTALKALVMPLLHLHHSSKAVLAALQLALPNTAISNISSSFGLHHGCQWFTSFSMRDREWWREPDVPWQWYPTLCIAP